ncbi:MAG: hypothetical protein COV34_00440 [Candidatus Zambryskibacteria bacterium CG10_big_fil_rev_8_21_14_0_10_42_12]|uniref:Uncharacterized protein n=1 Tax=Candidatus Zambryskibacteria bacterium CG10_big_fil_rev_8_21_14_0_10_42_12 TaxID=1975115 RepID=A0A2H0QWX8_9BACT|nr:MAG: hypothetical protein COV34_00440 [Candidatus Zambryskibacteria bacterium CG10_big_fil_rev_8_21_14_0_10_42_12]
MTVRRPAPPSLLVAYRDLGVLKIPPAYQHDIQLARFRAQYPKGIQFNPLLTDDNFSSCGHMLRPWDKVRVRVFRLGDSAPTNVVIKEMSTESVFVGAQGLSLVFTHMQDKLENGRRYVAPLPRALALNDGTALKVPCFRFDSELGHEFQLGFYYAPWLHTSDLILQFERVS